MKSHSRQVILSYSSPMGVGEAWRPGGGVRLIQTMDKADSLSLESTSDDDGVAGIGMVTVRVDYLDVGGLLKSVVVAMTGRTPVLAGVDAYRVLNMEAVTVGSSGSNVGTVTASIAGDEQLEIPLTSNRSHGLVYTVPVGWSFRCSSIAVHRLNVLRGLALEWKSPVAGSPWIQAFSVRRGAPLEPEICFGALTDIRMMSRFGGTGVQVVTVAGEISSSAMMDFGTLPPRMDAGSPWAP